MAQLSHDRISSSLQKQLFTYTAILKILFVGVFLFLLSTPALAQPYPTELNNVSDGNGYPLLYNGTIFFPEDFSDQKPETISWQDIASAPTTIGKSVNSFIVSVENYELPAWIRVDFQTDEIPTEQWLVDTANNFGGDIEVALVKDGAILEEYKFDNFNSFYERPYLHRRAIIPVDLVSDNDYSLILKLNKLNVNIFALTLSQREAYEKSDREDTWFQGIQLGIVLALMFYHLILAGATLIKSYLTYSIYIATNCLFVLSISGFGFQYFWPDSPTFEMFSQQIIAYLPTIMGIVFTLEFLNLKKLSPAYAKTFYVFLGILTIMLGIRISGGHVPIFALIVIALVIHILYIAAGIYAFKKGVVYAKYFLISWTIYCFALVNWSLVLVGIPSLVPVNAYTFLLLAFDAQVILLSLALAHRIRIMRDEKLVAVADNKAKSEFLARMSHEIRTPLSGVLGMSELLSHKLSDKTDIYYNNIIRSSGTSLLTIINDILDYSKFNAGTLELESIPFNIQRLAVDSLDVFKVNAAEKHLELIADMSLDLPTFVMGDPTRLKQIMLNFISNAIKFTDSGQVVLSVSYENKEKNLLKICVTDSGAGIPEEEQKNLFEAFAQANKSTARKHGGTGLGLAICKQLAELMGGGIGLSSEPGKGSSFWVTVKLPEGEDKQEAPEETKHNLEGVKLLIVEDNRTFAELLRIQAESWEMNPTVVHDGEQAIKALESAFNSGHQFELISFDWFMPRLDGLEASRQIQADNRFNHIPRLLLTSATNFPARHQLMSAGISKVVEKPSLPADLLAIYQQLLSKQIAANELHQKPANEEKGMATLDILVVEDNKVNQMVIKGILQRLFQTPTIVDDGKDAVELITRKKQKFDLVLMDCEMADIDGITATRMIREWEANKNQLRTPIVALTAHAVQGQMETCAEAGMDGYMTKPIEINRLKELLDELIDTDKIESFSIEEKLADKNQQTG